ncbi:helix-turn-helix domain-containing protein [Cohaesibacter haloalkalitolerans]|uniref:helix-turn-helix domain-containing protein n=1 Tax=Cohaesibacter haloalkalitolerans TaxID=1162980 RepID=UPI000E654E47|nr:helix-turn-helix domain-containing protein [Cohaesibacter haloalkalitolerans]
MKLQARTPKELGHAIRQARKTQSLTQKDLAIKSGVWQETISKIERGVVATKIETVFDLLAALDMELQIQPRTKVDEADLEEIF